MSRIAALALTAGAVIWVRGLGSAAPTGSAGTALVLGFALVGAWVTGDLLRRFNLPRLTGYLLFGIVAGPQVANVITESMAGQLQVITGIATTLIALIAGLTLNLERMGRRLAAIVQMTAVMLGLTMAGLAVLLWLAWSWLPIAPSATGGVKLAMLALFVVIVVSFSPTMTAAVITDTGARGRLSETILAMVVLADLAVLVSFSFLMQIARLTFRDAGSGDTALLVRFAWQIGGAVAFGVLVGALFALYMRYIGREVTLVLLGVCIVLSQVGSTQEFEPLLAAVAAGLVIENLAVAQGDTLRAAVQRGAPPVLVVFFAAVGSSLRLDALAAIGYVALTVSVVRIALIHTGLRIGWRLAGLDERLGKYAWTGLVSQSGITLGFASVVAAEFPGWGTQIQLVLVGLIAIHELVGPIVFRQGLVRARESRCPRAETPRGRVQPRALSAHRGCRRSDCRECRDRWRRHRARCVDEGEGWRLDCARRWLGGPSGRRRHRSRARPTREPVLHASTALAGGADVLRLLRWFRQRRLMAALSRRRRAAEIPCRGLGRLSGHQRSVCFGRSHGARAVDSASVHSGLPFGARRATPSGGSVRRQDGLVLAHPVALP